MFHTIKQQFSNLLNNIFIQPKNKFLNYEKNSIYDSAAMCSIQCLIAGRSSYAGEICVYLR